MIWWWIALLIAAAAVGKASAPAGTLVEDALGAVDELASLDALIQQLSSRRSRLLTQLGLPQLGQVESFHSQFVPKLVVASRGGVDVKVAGMDLVRITPPTAAQHAKRHHHHQHTTSSSSTKYYSVVALANGTVSVTDTSSSSSSPETAVGFSVLPFRTSGDTEGCVMGDGLVVTQMKAVASSRAVVVVTLDSAGELRVHSLSLLNSTSLPELAYSRGGVTAFALHQVSSSRQSAALVFATKDGQLVSVTDVGGERNTATTSSIDLEQSVVVTGIAIQANSVAVASSSGQIAFASLQPFKLVAGSATCLINSDVLGSVTSLAWVDVSPNGPFVHRNRFLVVTTSRNDVLLVDRKFQGGWQAATASSRHISSSRILQQAFGAFSTKRAGTALVCSAVKRLRLPTQASVWTLPGSRFLLESSEGNGGGVVQVYDALGLHPVAELERNKSSSVMVVMGRASLVDETVVLIREQEGEVVVAYELLLLDNGAALRGGGGGDGGALASWFGDWFSPHKLLLPVLAVVAAAFQIAKQCRVRGGGLAGGGGGGGRAQAMQQARQFEELLMSAQRARPTTTSGQQQHAAPLPRRQQRLQQQRRRHVMELLDEDDEDDEDDDGEEEEEEHYEPPPPPHADMYDD